MPHQIYIITSFKIVAPYTLHLTFNDGVEKTINLYPALRGELYGPLRDLDFFNKVKLDREAGTIVWPNGADFDPATLHDWDEVGPEMIEMANGWDVYSTAQMGKERIKMSIAEVLPAAQQLSLRDKLKLVRLLIEEIDAEGDIFPLEANKSYYIATPYDVSGAGQASIRTNEKLQAKGGTENVSE